MKLDPSTPDSSGQINRQARGGQPLGRSGEIARRDVARPDTKGKVAGGPAHHTQTIADSASKRGADIVTRLRSWVNAVDAVSASDLMDKAAAEIARLRLTEAEREALEFVAVRGHVANADDAATLRGLMERLK